MSSARTAPGLGPGAADSIAPRTPPGLNEESRPGNVVLLVSLIRCVADPSFLLFEFDASNLCKGTWSGNVA